MPLSKFGPFAPVFAQGELSVPGHLELLHLQNDGAQIVIDRVQHALSAGDPRHWLDTMFDDSNWRPHLVGAVALILDDATKLEPAGLWRAVDAGSWVLPQLVATAYFIDSQFPDRVRYRIQNRCPISPPASLSPAERHSATGPGTTVQRSAKLLASLLFVGSRVSSLSRFLEHAATEQEIAQLRAADTDDANGIAQRWTDNLLRQFALRGRSLAPKAA